MATIQTFSEVDRNLGLAVLLPQIDSNYTSALTVLANPLADTFVFQYFPEQVGDRQSTNYDRTQIPGGSHPLYQWISLGERVITLTARFTSSRLIPPAAVDVTNPYNVDVNGAVASLKYFYYPSYSETAQRVLPPLKLLLVIPGLFLGGYYPPISVIMTDLSVEYDQFHTDTQPKSALVNMTFAEVVQSASSGVRFKGREQFVVPKTLYRNKGPISRAV